MIKKSITTFYAKDENKRIYKVETQTENNNTEYIYINLYLVCGYDYIDADNNDVQGYILANNFTEDVQYDGMICYIVDESIKACLVDNGYTIIDTLPTIY